MAGEVGREATQGGVHDAEGRGEGQIRGARVRGEELRDADGLGVISLLRDGAEIELGVANLDGGHGREGVVVFHVDHVVAAEASGEVWEGWGWGWYGRGRVDDGCPSSEEARNEKRWGWGGGVRDPYWRKDDR